MSEIIPIYESPEPVGDLFFVHGLGGDAQKTWGFDRKPSWQTWLTENRPDLNIWSLGYRVEPSEWRGGSMPLFDRAVNVLALLDNHGTARSRPLCFICHSLGGLLVKEMLRHSRDVTRKYKYIADNTKGIVFFSTPHSGSDAADFAERFGPLFRTSVALEELEAQHPRLRDLNIWFRNNFDALGLKICIFFETLNTFRVRVVNETSADPGIKDITPIGIDANHLTIAVPDEYHDISVGQTLRLIDEALPSTTFKYDPRRVFESLITPAATTRPGYLNGKYFGKAINILYKVISLDFVKQAQALVPAALPFFATYFQTPNPDISEELWFYTSALSFVASALTYNISRPRQRTGFARIRDILVLILPFLGFILSVISLVFLWLLVENLILSEFPTRQYLAGELAFSGFFVGLGLASGWVFRKLLRPTNY
jgi:hypothetical protein